MMDRPLPMYSIGKADYDCRIHNMVLVRLKRTSKRDSRSKEAFRYVTSKWWERLLRLVKKPSVKIDSPLRVVLPEKGDGYRVSV